ncbi:hypothetical protein C5167_034749 [Papaver somniferum]|uniref:Uncharacterized protein n=1 Tax=Papaver somniferum TaxID=3469 RepID=A0A4Y7KI11_PAPSO|nr:hypothetical protein C5167_034749 [Papaver somniferum]
MAGRLKDNMVVNFNDQGVEFYEVKIKARLCDFMMKPDEFPLSPLLPSEVVSVNFVKEVQVIVQVNMFDCGGTAISLCISHKIADACTISTSIRNWAGNTYSARRGGALTGNQNLLPSFDAAALFPPTEQLAAIKSAPSDGFLPTVNHVVSFRKKMDPPLPDASFGNLCVVVTTAATPGATTTSTNDGVEGQEVLEDQLAELVAQLRGEKCKVKGDEGCIEKIFLSFVGGDNALWIGSWFYDADFEWGKPVWVTTDLNQLLSRTRT